MESFRTRLIAFTGVLRRLNPVSAIVVTIGGFVVANFVGAVVYLFIISVMGLDMNEAKRLQGNILVNFAVAAFV